MSLVERLLSLLSPPVPEPAPVGVKSVDRPVRRAAETLGVVTDRPGEAVGRALGGQRVSCWLDPELPWRIDAAVRRHAPVVVVSPVPVPGAPVELRPRSAQEAVDLLVLAHAIASRALVPAVLVWADAPAEVALPSSAVRDWLGAPADEIPAPTEAQRIAFDAEKRPRLPRWFDLDRPVLLGPRKGPAAVRDAAQAVWFTDAIEALLAALLDDYEAVLGRKTGRVQVRGSGSTTVLAAGPVTGEAVAGARLVHLAISRPPLGVREAVADGPLVVVDDAVPGGTRGPTSASSDLGPLLAHIGRGGRAPRFVGVEVVASQPASAHRQALDARLLRARPEVERVGLATGVASANQPRERVPAIVRALGRSARGYDSVARFWTEVGQPLAAGAPLTADPYQALDLLPSRTASLRDRSATRERLPAFDPAKCTGCGACWVACPDSALHAVAVGPEAVIGDDSALKPVAGPLRAALVAVLDAGASTAGEALRAAGVKVAAKLPENRAAPVKAALERQAARVGAAQVAHTERLGDALLALAVDPAACSACGACSDACQDDALVAMPQEGRLEAAWAAREAFDALPDTEGATLARLKDEGFDALGVLLLTRACSMALAGGQDGAEGDKRSIRALAAVAEARRQPRVLQQLHGIQTHRSRLSEQIDAELARVLPTSSGALADALAAGDLPGKVGQALASIDQRSLHHKAVLSHRLGQLAEALPERARFGLVLTSGVAAAASRYPYNPFAVPVAVTDDADEILGLAHTLVARAIDEAGLSRSASDAVKGRRPGSTALPARYDELDRQERAWVPPLVVVTDVPPPAALLDSGLPIKVLLLVGSPDGGHAEGLLALSRRGTFTLQSAIGEPDHLVPGLHDALEHDGPALMRVLTDPEASWPLLRFDAMDADPLVAEARRLAEAAVATEHADAVARLKAEHAAEVAALRSRVEAELAERVRGRLMQLAGYSEGGQA